MNNRTLSSALRRMLATLILAGGFSAPALAAHFYRDVAPEAVGVTITGDTARTRISAPISATACAISRAGVRCAERGRFDPSASA